MACLPYTWRPFIHMMYGAVQADEVGGAPVGCRFVRQIVAPPTWLRAFLDEVSGNLVRKFPLRSHLRRVRSVVLTTDASIYGVGAVLEVDGAVIEYFHDSPSEGDRALLHFADRPDPADQHVLEAFVMLLALRTWCSY